MARAPRAATLAGLALVCCAPLVQGGDDPPSLEARAEALLVQARARFEIPALELCVLRRGERLLSLRLGEHAGERYRVGSLTKVVTAALVLREVESGALRLGEPLGALWSDAPAAWRAATLEELLAHVSGLADFAAPGSPWWARAHESRTPEELLFSQAGEPPDFEAGRAWAYSNTGYLALGRALEERCGTSYAALVEQLARELELEGLHACWRAGDAREGPSSLPPLSALRQVDACAGLCAGALDFARFGAALLEGRVLGTQSFALMSSPLRLADGRALPNGLGLFVGELAGGPALSHSGAVHGYRAYLLLLPEHALSLCLLAASELAPIEGLARALALVALGLPPGPEGDGEPPRALGRLLLGRWRSGALELELSEPPGGLVARVLGGPGARLCWLGGRRFEAALGAPSWLTLSEDGRTLELRQGERTLRMRREREAPR